MPEINLLENRLRDTTFARERQIKIMLVVFFVILIVLIVFTGVMFFLNRSLSQKIVDTTASNQALQKKITEKQQTLTSATTYQAQLSNLQTLLKSHTYLSPLLDALEKATYVKSQYVTLDLEKNGAIHVEGKVGSYKDLGKLMLGLSTSQQFKDVKLISVAPAGDLLVNNFKFTIDMSVPPDIFYKK